MEEFQGDVVLQEGMPADTAEGGAPKKSLKDLKLNYPRTIKVGLGFAVVMIFWTVYNFVMPLLLEQAFGFSNTLRNVIVGIGSVLSIFLLPLFGRLSDKTKSRFGRRTPYIIIGTLITIVAMVFLPLTVQGQLKKSEEIRAGYTVSFSASDGATLIDGKTRETLMGEWYDLAKNEKKYTYVEKSTVDAISREEYIKLYNVTVKKTGGFMGMGGGAPYYVTENGVERPVEVEEYERYEKISTNYTKYAAFGVKAYMGKNVNSNISGTSLAFFIICLLGILLSQTVIRTPAVSLMPDVTPGPLRSPGNAMINLIGGAGGAIGFLIYTVTFMVNPALSTQYWIIFGAMAGALALVLLLFKLFVKEPQWVAEYEVLCEEYGLPTGKKEDEKEAPKQNMLQQYGKPKMTSFFLILGSIFMWFLGYSGISTNLSVYCVKVLNLSAGLASVVSGASMLVSAIGFIPVGILARKIGRRWSIIVGFALAIISFILVGAFVRPWNSPMAVFTLCYLISGFGLIFANVNTLPMVLELATPNDVGRFTGFYYVATMSAQALGPIIGGLVMDYISTYALFFYSAICVAIGGVLMYFVKHGESQDFSMTKRVKPAPVGADQAIIAFYYGSTSWRLIAYKKRFSRVLCAVCGFTEKRGFPCRIIIRSL